MASENAQFAEFSGCLYESPTPDGGDRDWRVDSATGREYPFDLTVSEVKNMKIEGVPIRLEHHEEGFERGDEVGRVVEVSTHPVTGHTACKFRLHDTIAGRTAADLIENDTLRSLSLGHEYDVTTGATKANEVSICFEGARKGSRVYKEIDEYEKIKKENMSAANAQSEPVVDAPATAAVSTPVETAPQEDAPVADDAAPVAPPPAAERDLTDLLHEVAKGQPAEIAEQLFEQIATIAERVKSGDDAAKVAEQKMSEMRAQNEALQKQLKNSDEAMKKVNAEAEQKAKEAVAVFNSLMKQYVGATHVPVDYDEKAPEDAYKKVAHSVPVLASALHRHQTVQAEQQNATLSKLGQQIRQSLFSAPSEPIWSQPAPQNQVVAVNASHRADAGEAGPSSKRFKSMPIMSERQMALLSGIGENLDDSRLTRDFAPPGAQRT